MKPRTQCSHYHVAHNTSCAKKKEAKKLTQAVNVDNIIDNNVFKKLSVLFFSGCQTVGSHTLFLCPSRFVRDDKRTKNVYPVVPFPAVVFHLIVLCAI